MNPDEIGWSFEFSSIFPFLLKVSLVLVVAWSAHLCLRRCNPRWRMLLWRSVVCSLILIPVLSGMVPVYEVDFPAGNRFIEQFYLNDETPVASSSVNTLSSTTPNPSNSSIQEEIVPRSESVTNFNLLSWVHQRSLVFISTLWSIFALFMAFRLISASFKLQRFIKRAKPAPTSIIQQFHNVTVETGCTRPISLRCSSELMTPILCGLRNPVLLLPERMTEASYGSELPGVFAHELSHLQSRDLWWVAGLQWLQVVFWFHPLVWRMRWAHDHACDEICDAFAADYMGNTQTYSKLLAQLALDMVSRPPVYGGITMATKSDVRKRLEFLKTSISTFPLTKKSVGAFISVTLLSLFSIAGLQPLMQSDKAMAGEQATENDMKKKRQSLIVRQLSMDYFPETYGLPSRDGRYVPGFDWDDMKVVLREIETGNVIDLTPKTQSEYTGSAVHLSLSPDGKTLAYYWLIDSENEELRLVNTDGTNNRLLLKLETVPWNIQWTNDGQYVFCSFIESKTDSRFVLISAEDGTIKTLKTVSSRTGGYLSPDGKCLAYGSYASGSKNNGIVVMSLEDQKEYPVVSNAAVNDVYGWSPDGKWILFSSNRSGTKDFYISPFTKQSRPESAIFIKKNSSLVTPVGITPEGKFYYQEYMPNNNVYTASIDWKTKTVQEDSDPISQSVIAAVKWRPEWSTDGNHITFRADDLNNDTHSLYLYSLQDKQTRKITPDVSRIRRWRLSPDNKEIVFTEQTADVPNPVVHRINLTTGANETLLKEEHLLIPQYSSDLKKAYAFTWRDAQFKLFEIDLETKKKRTIFEDTKENHSLRLSPDGKWMVCYRQSDQGEAGSLRLISIETGEHQDVCQVKAGNPKSLYPHLVSDGKYIVYNKGQYDNCVLWRVNIDTKQKDKLGAIKGWVLHVRVSPSGDKLSYTKPASVTTNWVMENIFPTE
ncbi:MAG: PD40 domain-containing protein [Phycisphaeraceae bacterium]|nr:PD40 domain-containing protein [Phycisphaeraceae bacterium]